MKTPQIVSLIMLGMTFIAMIYHFFVERLDSYVLSLWLAIIWLYLGVIETRNIYRMILFGAALLGFVTAVVEFIRIG